MDNEQEVLGPKSYMIVRGEKEVVDDPTLTFMDDIEKEIEKEIESTGEAVFACVAFLALILVLAYVVTSYGYTT